MIGEPRPDSFFLARFNRSYPSAQAMAGGALYETNHHHNQELMTDWTPSVAGLSGGARREKEKYGV